MDTIVNEVELKKAAREKQRIETLKKEGKKDDEIAKLLPPQKPKKEVIVCKNAVDIQKRKLDRLMSNMLREAYIPEPRKEWKPREAPEFVRHVMGSSAGAGSGEFHVYRGIRKREKKRQDYLDRKAVKEELDEAYHEKLDVNKTKAEEITAKKRAKRQKKKQKKLMAKKIKQTNDDKVSGEKSETQSDNENESESDHSNEEEDKHFVIGGK